MFNSCTWINYFIHISQKIYLNEYDLRQIITEQWSPKTCNSSSVRPRHFCFPVSCDFDFYHSIHKSSLIEAAIIVFVLNYIKCLTFKYFNISCTNQDQSPWGIQFFFFWNFQYHPNNNHLKVKQVILASHYWNVGK